MRLDAALTGPKRLLANAEDLAKLRLKPTSTRVAEGAPSRGNLSYSPATRGLAVLASQELTVSYTFGPCKHG